MRMQLMIGLLIAASLWATAQSALPKTVQESLVMAGSNRSELCKLIGHYKSQPEKLNAAYWLIEQMRWHYKSYSDIKPDQEFLKIFHLADSLYYGLVQARNSEEIMSNLIRDSINSIKREVQALQQQASFREPEITYVDNEDATDLQTAKAQFLIGHIDNAFLLKGSSNFVKRLSAAEFNIYMLPYRTTDGKLFRYSGKDFNLFFSKYLGDINNVGIAEAVARYNLTVRNLRIILGDYPLLERTGFEELFFNNVRGFDCFSVSSYASAALTACGIPLDVEYNSAYQMLQDKHSMCRVPQSLGYWTVFSPESSVPVQHATRQEIVALPTSLNSIIKMNAVMNLYKIHFGAQRKTPYFLKAKEELIPSNLDDPCIEDVTSDRMYTVSVTLPFKEILPNNLAYLATFNSASGVIPVNWATVNKKTRTVQFKNVLPDRLYFPVYMTERGLQSFGDAFLLKYDSTKSQHFSMLSVEQKESDSLVDLVLIRKFPRKPNMVTVARNLVNTVVMGADSANFKVRDTLCTLNYELQPYLQDLDLNNRKAYRYYRVEAPLAHHSINISEIQFLTDKEYNYPNTIEPSDLPTFSPTAIIYSDTNLTRLLDDEPGKYELKAEYDGKMTTAPGVYAAINFKLKEPQVVTKIRLAPLNADNGVKPGNEYQLCYWGNGKWNDFGHPQTAQYNYLALKGVPQGKLYWLKNISGGKEELPFIIDKNGQQQFLYFDLK